MDLEIGKRLVNLYLVAMAPRAQVWERQTGHKLNHM
jgi:hypothetical protein